MTRLLSLALAGLIFLTVSPSLRAQDAESDSFPGTGIIRFLKDKLTPTPPTAAASAPVAYEEGVPDRGPVRAGEVVAAHRTRGGVSVICTNCD